MRERLHAISWIDAPGWVWYVKDYHVLAVGHGAHPRKIRVPVWVSVTETDHEGGIYTYELPEPLSLN